MDPGPVREGAQTNDLAAPSGMTVLDISFNLPCHSGAGASRNPESIAIVSPLAQGET